MTLSRVCEHHPSKGVHVTTIEGKPSNVTALCGAKLKGVLWLRKSKVTCPHCRAAVIRMHAERVQ